MKAYINARVFTGTEFLTGVAVITDKGIVTDILSDKNIPAAAEIIDVENNLLAPAFIDIQIYGGNGKLFSQELSAEAIQSTYEYCLSGGASHFFITLATNSMDVFLRGIDAVRAYWQQGGKGMPGLHLEGPYINPLKRGAHIEKYIKKVMTKSASCAAMIKNNRFLFSSGEFFLSKTVSTITYNNHINAACQILCSMLMQKL